MSVDQLAKGRSIGLIGGLGVGAAVHYYKELAKAHASRGRVLDLVMVHADMARVRGAVEAADKDGLASYLAELIGRLRAAGADFAVIPAVAPHIAVRELIERSPLPVINMIAELRCAMEDRGLPRVALFGTRYVIESRLFGCLNDMDVVRPHPDEVDYIHETYFSIVNGSAGPQQREGLRSLARTLIERDRVDAIILAGTDLALVFDETNADFPYLDAARVHLNAILRRAMD